MTADPVLTLTKQWGAGIGDVVAMAKGERVTAALWRHNVPEFPDTPVPFNFLGLLLRPAVAERIRGRRCEIPGVVPGSVMLAPGGSDGRWLFRSQIETLHLYLPQDLLDLFSKGGRRVELHDTLNLKDPVVARLLREVLVAMQGEDADRLYADALGVALAARLAELHACNAAVERLSAGGLPPRRLRLVLAYLDTHIAETVGVSDLATLAGLSPYHFIRAFKQSTGLPPHAWLTRRRMERAREMMRAHPQLGLSEIALAVGYENQSAFTTAFKRVVGATPARWRMERTG